MSPRETARLMGLRDSYVLPEKALENCIILSEDEVILVGGGDTAAEEATYLAKLCKKVTMLVRRDEMRASKAMRYSLRFV